MAVPTNTVQTFQRGNIREDLTDIISNISPTETPFISNIGTGMCKQRLHEWQVDTLIAAVNNNAQIEGNDAVALAAPGTNRRNNYCQLADKVVSVSDTARAVNNAGYSDELAYQMAKRSKELKRDIELSCTSNNPAVPGNAGLAGQSAGAVAFIISNRSQGATGAAPTLSGSTTGYPNAGETLGTLRSITESMVKTVMAAAWTAGGSPTIVNTSGVIKQTMSTFAGIAQQRRETKNKAATIIGAADVYVSDFGDLTFVPSRFTTGRNALVLDPSLWMLADLQPYQTVDLAKTGHSDKKMLFREWTLVCENESGNGNIADVQP